MLVQHTLFVVYVLGVSSGYPRNIGFLRILLTHPVQLVSATMDLNIQIVLLFTKSQMIFAIKLFRVYFHSLTETRTCAILIKDHIFFKPKIDVRIIKKNIDS